MNHFQINEMTTTSKLKGRITGTHADLKHNNKKK